MPSEHFRVLMRLAHTLRPAALVLLCACHAGAPRPVSPPEQTPLPENFGPVGWDATLESLRARFPEASVGEGEPQPASWRDEEDGRELMAVELSASDAHLEPFGTVDIRVMGFVGQPPAVLVIQRSDNPGVECFPEGASEVEGRACWERRRRERRAVYDALAASLIARYGPGRLDHLESEAEHAEGEPVDLEQSERSWALPELEVRLALGLDPRFHATEMVRLVASRDWRYPY